MVRTSRHAPRRGFTLIELLTVIALIALIGSLGAGAFHAARRNYSLTSTAGRLQGVVRAARNSALTSGGPSFVIVDPVRRTVASHLFEPIGEWGFDGDAQGGLVASRETVQGGTSAAGKLGGAMDFSGGGYVLCGTGARYQLRTSILAEAWVKHSHHAAVKPRTQPTTERKGLSRRPSRSNRSSRPSRSMRTATASAAGEAGAIFSKEGSWFLGMTRRGVLEGAIGGFRVRTREPVVPADRWVHVALRYDGRGLELSADGVPRPWRIVETPLGSGAGDDTIQGARASARADKNAAKREQDLRALLPSTVPLSASPLTISSPGTPFPGVVDEVLLYGSVEPLEEEWADFEHVIGWKKIVRFDGHGRLDSRFHDEPVRIRLIELPDSTESSTSTTVVTDYSVTFAEWLARWEEPPPDLTEASEEAKVLARYGDVRLIEITIDRLGTVSSTRLR